MGSVGCFGQIENIKRQSLNNIPQEKPWYRKFNSWAWIVMGTCVLAFIIIMAMDTAEKKAKANRPKPRSYEEVFTPEEAKRMGIGGRIDGPGDWKPGYSVWSLMSSVASQKRVSEQITFFNSHCRK